MSTPCGRAPLPQEDSHELLRRLLEHACRSALRVAGVREGAPGRLDETTALHRIFGGYFRNQLRCPACSYCSNSYESFMDLSLEVGRSLNTVEAALRHFSKPETLDARNKWTCPACKVPVQARKQLTIRKVRIGCGVEGRDAVRAAGGKPAPAVSANTRAWRYISSALPHARGVARTCPS